MHMKKGANSETVINLVPPRELWPQMQKIRMQYLPNQRCGPHFSFVEPFVTAEHYPEAAALLTEVLKDIPAFTVTFENFSQFVFKSSAMFFADPTIEPPDALRNLLDAITKVFPQCTDQIDKAPDKRYIPHLSLARFKSGGQIQTAKPKLIADWKPITWVVDEIYLLHRIGGDPFMVKHVIPLKGKTGKPSYGPGSPGSESNDESAIGRSLVVCRFPQGWNDNALKQLFVDEGFNIAGAEVQKNPDKKPRNCGVVEFATRGEADRALINFKSSTYPDIYLNPLWGMAFPDVVGGSCTF